MNTYVWKNNLTIIVFSGIEGNGSYSCWFYSFSIFFLFCLFFLCVFLSTDQFILWKIKCTKSEYVLNSTQCPIWHVNVTNSFKFTKFLLTWKVDFFNQRGYQGANKVHYLYFYSSWTQIHEEIVVFLIISRKKSLLAWTGKK